jgi:hypothetical protein
VDDRKNLSHHKALNANSERIAQEHLQKRSCSITSVSEAIRMELSIITARNAWTMPQDRNNTQWVREQQAGIVARSFRALRPALSEVIGRLPELRARIARIDNRALFEVPDILAAILRGNRSPQRRASADPAVRAVERVRAPNHVVGPPQRRQRIGHCTGTGQRRPLRSDALILQRLWRERPRCR